MTMTRDDVRVATPCTLDWSKMKPSQGGRFCGDCKKVVRDLSSMTETDARDLLERQRRGEKVTEGGELCVRFLYDKHGRVFFKNMQRAQDGSPLVPANLLSRARRAAATVALAALPIATAACDIVTSPLGMSSNSISEEDPTTPPPEYHEMMGGAPSNPDPIDPNPGGADGGADAAVMNNNNKDAMAPITPVADGGPTTLADGGVSIY